MSNQVSTLVAVAARVTGYEAALIDSLALGKTRSDTLRVLVRFALKDTEAVRQWWSINNG